MLDVPLRWYPITDKFLWTYLVYADDTQLYIPLSVENQNDTINKAENCIKDIKSWMSVNKLKLNENKTEIILLGTTKQRNNITIDSLEVGSSHVDIEHSGVVRNLGSYFNSDLSMQTSITKTCQAAHLSLRNIGKIRRMIDGDTAKILVHALITSRLDYCNSLLLGTSQQNLNRLQKIQNKAARLITRDKASTHIQPVLRSLHWLPVKERIEFKSLCFVFKCLHDLAPQYLKDLFKEYQPVRTLRSSDALLLETPSSNLALCGKAFSVSGAKLWNSISLDTRTSSNLDIFKRKLKTELFKKAFEWLSRSDNLWKLCNALSV